MAKMLIMLMVVWYLLEVKVIELVYGHETGEMRMLQNELGKERKMRIFFFCVEQRWVL
jgi:hypothetical protein